MDPYAVLGIAHDADDATIRRAYLELVRQFPPERAAERFTEINEAYNKVKEKRSRLEYYLFNRETRFNSPFEVLISHFAIAGKRKPPTFEEIKEYLKKCATR